MVGIASAATAVAIGYVAGGTDTIRVGAGGIMLPNHSPLVIAEQFGTLESLYPGRIDLGLGARPAPTSRRFSRCAAVRRRRIISRKMCSNCRRCWGRFSRATGESRPGHRAAGSALDSGLESVWCRAPAALGLPYAFASHFAPDALMPALEVYRAKFQPSAQLARPYVMVGANVIAAETEAGARRLFTTLQQVFVGMYRNQRGQLPPPIDDIETYWSPAERAQASNMLSARSSGRRKRCDKDLSDSSRKPERTR